MGDPTYEEEQWPLPSDNPWRERARKAERRVKELEARVEKLTSAACIEHWRAKEFEADVESLRDRLSDLLENPYGRGVRERARDAVLREGQDG